MNNKSRAFTLAECMIVMLVVGVAFAILTPILFLTAPDQDRLKAKKAYHTLLTSVSIMINSPSYAQSEGSLNMCSYLDSDILSEAEIKDMRDEYFCLNMAEIVNAEFADCSLDLVNSAVATESGNDACTANTSFEFSSSSPRSSVCLKTEAGTEEDTEQFVYTDLRDKFDIICEKFYSNANQNQNVDVKTVYNFKTPDGILWAIQRANFSHNAKISQFDKITGKSAFYNVICINTDSNKSAEFTYGAGVNADGNILLGTKLFEVVEDDADILEGE